MVAPSPVGRLIRLPTRVSGRALFIFAATLFALQLASGTGAGFAMTIFAFIMLSGFAFNLTGGLSTVTGTGMTMLACKIVVVSQIAKIFFWQPADSHLEIPQTTALVLLVGLASMIVGIVAGGDLRRPRGWITPVVNPRDLLIGAIVCGLLTTACAALVVFSGVDAGSGELRTGGLVGLGRQFSIASPISIIFATAYEVTRTNGRRSFSPLVAATMLVSIVFGIAMGTKQGIFETVLFYALTCIAFEFRFRRIHLIILGICAVVGMVLVWPIMQAMKSLDIAKSATVSDKIEIATDVVANMATVSDFTETRDGLEELMTDERFEYYGQPMGWLERLSLIEQDDELVLSAVESGETGSQTITHAFEALVPSFINPDKPIHNTAGFLGRRIGEISDDDEDTQISFGIIAESFLAYSWLGVLIIPAVLLFGFVNTTGRLTGPFTRNVWSVYLIGKIQHSFVENTVSSFIQDMIVGSVILFLLSMLIRAVTTLPSGAYWNTQRGT